MSAELLVSIVTVVMSLFFAYIPGVKKWYDALPSEIKATVMGTLLIVASLSIFGLACSGLAADLQIAITCDKIGGITLVKVLISALVANQSTYMLAVRPFKKP